MSADMAWAAGLFEGEGCVVYGAKHSGPLHAKIKMTDRDVLDLMIERTGLGSVTGPRPPTGLGRKPVYQWRVNGRYALQFFEAVSPWLGQRRLSKIAEKVALYETRPLRPAKVTPAVREAILRDRAAGMVYREIAAKHSISLSRAQQVVTQ